MFLQLNTFEVVDERGKLNFCFFKAASVMDRDEIVVKILSTAAEFRSHRLTANEVFELASEAIAQVKTMVIFPAEIVVIADNGSENSLLDTIEGIRLVPSPTHSINLMLASVRKANAATL